jgi:tetratricopeptide (TPR) repeat protein
MTEDEAVAILRGDDPERAARAEAALWRMWSTSGIPDVDALLSQGIAHLERRDYREAERLFSAVVERAPAFAEGWNKRATARYLAEDFEGSIADCRETLARKPHHFGALSGQGLCHMALGQHRLAARMFRRTLAVHPHLEAARQNLRLALGESVKGNGH